MILRYPPRASPTSLVPIVAAAVQPRRRALVASASRVPVGDRARARELREVRQGDRRSRAWHVYDRLGEAGFVSDLFGNALSRIRLFAAEKPNPDEDPVPTDFAPAIAIVESFNNTDPDGGASGMTGLLRETGINRFVVGECYWLGLTIAGRLTWDVLSVDELKVEDSGRLWRVNYPGADPILLPPEAVLIRTWIRHPRFSRHARSPIFRALDTAEKLISLGDAMLATIRQRMNAGAWLIPEEASFAPTDPQADDEDDQLTLDLVEAFGHSVRDPRDPSASAPLIVRMAGALISQTKYESFDRALDEQLVDKALYELKRFAQQVDVPPEFLTGMGDATHWNAWTVTQNFKTDHLFPAAEDLCSDLIQGILRPALQVPTSEGGAGLTERQAGDFYVWYDDTVAATRPDRSNDAVLAHDRLAISDDALRREMAFSEDDAPLPDEKRLRIAIKLGDLSALGDVAGASVPAGAPGVPPPALLPGPAPEVPKTPPVTGPAPSIAASANGNGHAPKSSTLHATFPADGHYEPGTTLTAAAAVTARTRRLTESLTRVNLRLADQLQTSADAAVSRILERAGAKLRSHMRGNTKKLALTDQMASIPNLDLAAHLGPARLRTLGVTEDDLIGKGAEEFTRRADSHLSAAQKRMLALIAALYPLDEDLLAEIRDAQDRHRTAAAGLLLSGMTAWLTARLYEPRPKPPERGEFTDDLAPTGLLRDVVAVAAGGDPAAERAAGLPPSTIGFGPTAMDVLRGVGVNARAYSWVWSGAVHPFPPHQDLDGQEFAEFDDEILAVPPGYEWLSRQYLAPGDHQSCGCFVSVALEEEAAAEDVA